MCTWADDNRTLNACQGKFGGGRAYPVPFQAVDDTWVCGDVGLSDTEIILDRNWPGAYYYGVASLASAERLKLHIQTTERLAHRNRCMLGMFRIPVGQTGLASKFFSPLPTIKYKFIMLCEHKYIMPRRANVR